MTQSNSIAQAMYESFAAGAHWPLPSAAIAGLNAAVAYDVQREFVARRLEGDAIAGFKAGATAIPAQQAFGLDGPFTGVLLASGLTANGATVVAADFGRLLLETELCFRAGSSIDQPINDVQELRERIDGCFPAVELADAGGFGAAKFTGPDLIAGNGASASYMVESMVGSMIGDELDDQTVDLDQVTVSFSRDGETLHEAVSGNLMGGQWQALLWLVNAVVALGYVVQPGHLLLTGALGSPHPAQPGRHVADFGVCGQIAFEVI